MNIESVTEFLGEVPLIRRLPISSLKKIAQLLKVKYYDSGELVIGKRESEDGVYFVWEGEAVVCGHKEENHSDFLLKRYDYFGCGSQIFEERAEVAATSKINVFQGITPPDAPKFQKIYGGQFIGQALVAASRTVDCLKLVNHLQGHFLLVGNYDIPIFYQVHCLHDGKSFASRRVDAIQKGQVVFTLLASFHMEGNGFDHQEIVMPSVPPPDSLLSIEELRERRIIDPRFPQKYRNKLVMSKYDPWPVEIRFCDPRTYTSWTKSPASLRYWFRAKGKLPHNQPLHRMWFHRPVKADDWLLFAIESSSAHGGRGYCTGQMFSKNGEHIVSLVQEGALRSAAKAQNSAIRAKY